MSEFTNFSTEQMAVLEPYRNWFNTAVNAQYVRGISERNLDLIADVWKEATGERVLRHWNCGDCVVRFLAKVGRLFYESEKAAESPKNGLKRRAKK